MPIEDGHFYRQAEASNEVLLFFGLIFDLKSVCSLESIVQGFVTWQLYRICK